MKRKEPDSETIQCDDENNENNDDKWNCFHCFRENECYSLVCVACGNNRSFSTDDDDAGDENDADAVDPVDPVDAVDNKNDVSIVSPSPSPSVSPSPPSPSPPVSPSVSVSVSDSRINKVLSIKIEYNNLLDGNSVDNAPPLNESDSLGLSVPQSSPPPPPSSVNVPQGAGGSPPEHSELKLASATRFLEEIKQAYQESPAVYAQFLEIMREFKLARIQIPEVVGRVNTLFAGKPHLIAGFNNFLPHSFSPTSPMPSPQFFPQSPPPQLLSQQFPPQQQQHLLQQPQQQNLQPQFHQQQVSQQSSPFQQQRSLQPYPPTFPDPSNPPNFGMSVPYQQLQQEPVEFNHAKEYVKKIKNRFSSQPHMYKAFLDILQSHHREQSAITDVYDQIAVLFQQHPDLLEEFMQFLPDPMSTGSQHISGGRHVHSKPKRKRETKERSSRSHSKSRRKNSRKKESHPVERERLIPSGSYEELNFFFHVKQRLNDPPAYLEFLKCLNLFTQQIVTRMELVLLVRCLLERHRDLFEWFKQLVGFDDSSVELLEEYDDRHGTLNLHDIDLNKSKRCGPSYRAIPRSYGGEMCSGRTPLCHEVLNETWSSAATGSEDFGLKLPNEHEEYLFRCEDERFLVDLQIEQNLSTIRALELLEVKLHSHRESHNYGRLPDRVIDGILDVLDLRHIEQIYGPKGHEVIVQLYSEPTVVIPVLLSRLHRKNVDWSRLRRQFGVQWRKTMEKHYYRLTDTQSKEFIESDRFLLNKSFLKPSFSSTLQRDSVDTCLDYLDLSISTVFSASPDLKQNALVFLEYFLKPFFQSSMFLFADSTFYVLFQILLTIHDRLEKAKEFAILAHQADRFHDLFKSFEYDDTRSLENGKHRYHSFLHHLKELIHSGLLEVEEYQDDVFSLFGHEGYILFTMDKLFVQASAKIRDLISDGICTRLLALHCFENRYSQHLDCDQAQSIYLQNAFEILEQNPCYRIEYQRDSGILKAHLHSDQSRQSIVREGPSWSNFVYQSTTDEAFSEATPNSSLSEMKWIPSPLLWRNVRRVQDSRELEDLSLSSHTLEYCFHAKTSHLFYIQGTSDFLYKPGSLLKARASLALPRTFEQKTHRLETILSTKTTLTGS